MVRSSVYLLLVANAVVLHLGGVSAAADVADKATPENLKEVAMNKRAALIGLYFAADAINDVGSCGFFVSEDGMALCDLHAFARRSKPDRILTFDHKPLKMPKILAVFPDHDLALVQFSEHPDVWLKLREEKLPTRSQVAVMDVYSDTPAALGPALARISVVSGMNQPPVFQQLISLASGMRSGAQPVPAMGAPVIDSNGFAVGAFGGVRPKNSQTQFLFFETADLVPAIREALKKKGNIPFPLSLDLLGYDPAQFSVSYSKTMMAMAQGDSVACTKHLADLKKEFPESPLALQLEADMAVMAKRWNEAMPLVEALKPGLDAGGAETCTYLIRRSQALAGQGDIGGAIATLEASVALSPENHPGDRAILASLCLHAGRIDEAEKWYRAVLVSSLDDLDCWQGLQTILEEKGRWEESDKIAETIMDLEGLYRRR